MYKKILITLMVGFMLMFSLVSNTSAHEKREGWFYDFQTALAQARTEDKPIFILFSHPWCSDCKRLWEEALLDPSVMPYLKDFIPLYFDIDEAKPITKELAVRVVPDLMVLDPRDMSKLAEHIGYLEPTKIVTLLEEGLEGYKKAEIKKKEKVYNLSSKYTLRYRKNIGYSLESEDKNLVVDLWTYHLLSAVEFLKKEDGDDTSRYKHARLGANMTFYKKLTLMTQLDFAADNHLVDLYAEYQFTKPINLRIGRFKVEMGREYIPRRDFWDFIEAPSFILPLLPRRDVGAEIYGGGGYRGFYMQYVFGAFNGVPDGYDLNNANKEFAGKICFIPFPSPDLLLVIGGALTHGKTDSSLSELKILSGAGINKLLLFKTETRNAGHRDRVNLATELFYKNINIGAERVTMKTDVFNPVVGSVNDAEISSISSWLAWVVTGEGKKRDEWLVPKSRYGALEIVVRYSTLEVDNALLTFAKSGNFVEDAENLTAGINWYLTHHFKFMLNYSYTGFDREIRSTKGNLVDKESAVIGGIQFVL